ncbi:MAG: AraC family transcriptional regulator [Candidatus Delongbacteria bacterium]|nr:AraC family transcriptional regulator [Candidatus Delongbacteria bacterium]MBN2834469.1 AraC family transcriptional regulator [Candidatus Delongbacteria bacterium]
MNYLVLSIPVPLECETNASEDEPLLGVKINVDVNMIGEILHILADTTTFTKSIPKGFYSAPLDNLLLDSVIRLLEAITSDTDKLILAPMIVREIVYRVLMGEKGEALKALAYKNQYFFQIAQIVDKIHNSYDKKLDVNSLASEAGMSVSSFHTIFKTVTNSSPLQYIKNIRLHKARILMIEEGFNAHNAGYNVGYESPSQFNREYKRLFGMSPGRDCRNCTV